MFSGLKARHAWEASIGPILTHKQMLEVTGWTKQALSQAVREHRVLRVEAEDGSAGYVVAGFDGASPARPLPGIKEVLRVWAAADEQRQTYHCLLAEHRATRTRWPLPVLGVARWRSSRRGRPGPASHRRFAARADSFSALHLLSTPLHPTSCATASPAGSAPPAPGCPAPTEPAQGPCWFSSSGYSRNERAAPNGTCYAAETEGLTLLRDLGRNAQSCPGTELVERYISVIQTTTARNLADLTSIAATQLGVTAEIFTTGNYRLTQLGAAARRAAGYATPSDTGRGTTSPTPIAPSRRVAHRRRAHRGHAARLHR